jgi:hypothetical protein
MAKKKTETHPLVKTAVAGAALAGAYFLYGAQNAKKNRKVAKAWMLRAKADALEKIEKLQSMDEKDYQAILDSVRTRYSKAKDVTGTELDELIKELRGHWKDISKGIKSPAKKVAKKK